MANAVGDPCIIKGTEGPASILYVIMSITAGIDVLAPFLGDAPELTGVPDAQVVPVTLSGSVGTGDLYTLESSNPVPEPFLKNAFILDQAATVEAAAPYTGLIVIQDGLALLYEKANLNFVPSASLGLGLVWVDYAMYSYADTLAEYTDSGLCVYPSSTRSDGTLVALNDAGVEYTVDYREVDVLDLYEVIDTPPPWGFGAWDGYSLINGPGVIVNLVNTSHNYGLPGIDATPGVEWVVCASLENERALAGTVLIRNAKGDHRIVGASALQPVADSSALVAGQRALLSIAPTIQTTRRT